MRRLLEVGEIIQDSDFVIRHNERQKVPNYWTEMPVAEGDYPIYRNEPDSRAEMLAALEMLRNCDFECRTSLRIALESADSAIAAAKGETP